MKRIEPELGGLSTKLFAYIQLKKKEILRVGELSSILQITRSQELDLLRRLSGSGWIVRLKRGLYLVPPRIPSGGRYSPGIAKILQQLMEEDNGTYQVCGPSAFNYYRFDNQIPNVTYVYNNRISGNRSIGNLAFQFIKIADIRLGATITVRTREEAKLVYSSKARTLMDAVYDWSRFNSLPRGYDWIKHEVQKEPELSAELIEVSTRYGNQATARRIGYLLYRLGQPPRVLNRLKSVINDSTALIPWIPGKPAKGEANRKWGVIVNG
jgi:predicted transcriptional regulator of viral defense system